MSENKDQQETKDGNLQLETKRKRTRHMVWYRMTNGMNKQSAAFFGKKMKSSPITNSR